MKEIEMYIFRMVMHIKGKFIPRTPTSEASFTNMDEITYPFPNVNGSIGEIWNG